MTRITLGAAAAFLSPLEAPIPMALQKNAQSCLLPTSVHLITLDFGPLIDPGGIFLG